MSTTFESNNTEVSGMNSDLRPWAASWYPWRGYLNGMNVPDFPESGLLYSTGPRFPELTHELYRGGKLVPRSPMVGRGMFTYVPDGTLFSGMKLGGWGSQYGTRSEREAWVGRDLVGNFVLIRVKRKEPPLDKTMSLAQTELEVTEQALGEFKPEFYNEVYELASGFNSFRYEWLFAYVRGYNSYTGKHELEFKLDDIPVTGIWVDVGKCVCQEWGRADMRLLMKKIEEKEGETKERSAINIQRIWRGYEGRTYGNMPELLDYPDSPTPDSPIQDSPNEFNGLYGPESTTLVDSKPANTVGNKKKKKNWFQNLVKLPQRDPKTHPDESNFMSEYQVRCAFAQRDEDDAGEDSTPMESRHDERQWQKNRTKTRYWNNDVKQSSDWCDGNTEACEKRAKTKWNTVSKNGDNNHGTKGRKGVVAQRAKTQVRRNRRRKMHNDTRSAGSD